MSTPIQFDFDKNKVFMNKQGNAVGLELMNVNPSDILLNITKNEPFPDQDVNFAKMQMQANAGKDIKFGKGSHSVVFKGKAESHSGIQIFLDPMDAVKSLGITDEISGGFKIERRKKKSYALFQWGYDVEASAQGKVAFGAPVAIQFGASGSRERVFAVLQEFDKTEKSRTVIGNVINSWMMPAQLENAKQLDPYTWLITEVMSEIGGKLGVQVGYDFNWVKEINKGELSGDIGLRLELGLQAAFGFKASGKYALVIGRETDANALRMRLYKQRIKGWDFALSANVMAEPSTGNVLPGDPKNLIKAVFGTHGLQIVKGLEILEKWTDPNQTLSDMLTEEGVEYTWGFIEKVTGVHPETAFEEARSKLTGFLDKWNNLEHDLTAKIWNLLDEKVPLGEITNILTQVTEMNEDNGMAMIEEKLSDLDFMKSDTGNFIRSLVPDKDLFRLLTNNQAFGKFQEMAEKTLNVLDGSLMQETLSKLHGEINERLKIDKINDIVTQHDFDTMDKWLKAKVSEFLGETFKLKHLEDVKKTIRLVTDRSKTIYDKALKALNRKHEFNFSASYQKSTSNDALLDFTFDFDCDGTEAFLKEALNGNFDRVMVEKHPGVKLHKAVLTHGIESESNIELNLPFYDVGIKKINNSLAKAEAVDEDNGRVIIYELGAKDIIIRRAKRSSALTIGGYFQSEANKVRAHSKNGLSYSYTFRQSKRNMKKEYLQYHLKPYIKQYFPTTFSTTSRGTTSQPFDTWISDLDKRADVLLKNGTNFIGPTLLSLQVDMPANLASAWLNAPSDKKDPVYYEMSKQMQEKLKDFMPLFYFEDVRNIEKIFIEDDRNFSRSLVVYSSFPSLNSFNIRSGKIAENDRNIVMRKVNKSKLIALLEDRRTVSNIVQWFTRFNQRLLSTPGHERLAGNFNPATANQFIDQTIRLIKDDNNGDRGVVRHLAGLHSFQHRIITSACDAGAKLGTFVENLDKPTEAVKILAEFGEKISKAFNRKINGWYAGEATRALGPMLFYEASKVFTEGIDYEAPNALFDLVILNEADKQVFKEYLQQGSVDEGNVLIHQRLLDIN